MSTNPVVSEKSGELVPSPSKGAQEIKSWFKEPIPIAEVFRRLKKEMLVELIAKHSAQYPELLDESFSRHLLRFYEPWPDWTLRIAAEVLHVNYPTLPKKEIEQFFRFLHFWVFEFRLDCSIPRESWVRFPKFEDASWWGSAMGHIIAQVENVRHKAKQFVATHPMTPEKRAEFEKLTSFDEVQRQTAPLFSDYFKQRPEKSLELLTAMTNAKGKTFDESGLPKETTLTRIYKEIFAGWPVIEELSGVTALTEYLKPHLGNGDIERQQDRVKKIVKRMGITFKPYVKGQTHPPTLSLPPKV
jgi:hypothetical protein